MKRKGIEVIVRARPTPKVSRAIQLEANENKIIFDFPKDDKKGYVDNTALHFQFKFDHVLDQESKQEDVFDRVARDVVDTALEGYNGTIFAYGQTGSGKTFTITGGTERYVDRGIIPRGISYLFSECKKRSHSSYRINISYMEIYNDEMFDLLDEDHATKNLFDLPRVSLRENENGEFVMRNLSVHRAETEEDALNLLFIGDTNRVVSETPKNDASTRSHCIFIVMIEAQKYGEDVKTVSKLHLVDLSGSERVGKTGVEGVLLKEAKFINVSLHFLEHVIVSLNQRSKGEQVHVPYRNSRMTMVLRDSIGGNCLTKMIANISPAPDDVHESLSTCHFARRVSKIQNDLTKNEMADPGLIISRLKKEIAELKSELTLLKGGDSREHLEAEEVGKCNKLVDEFITNTDPSSSLLLNNKLQINQCFYHFKHLFLDMKKRGKGAFPLPLPPSESETGETGNEKRMGERDPGMEEELQRFQMLVKQRDGEIMILVNLLNKRKAQGESALVPISSSSQAPRVLQEVPNSSNLPPEESKERRPGYGDFEPKYTIQQETVHPPPLRSNPSSIVRPPSSPGKRSTPRTTGKGNELMEILATAPTNIKPEDLLDRTKAFEMFRKSYRKNQAMDENKELYKEKVQHAKGLAMDVNNTRNHIKGLTNKIEQLRRENAMRGMVNEENEVIKTPEEAEIQNEIQLLKERYQSRFGLLKEMKGDIEKIQLLLERSSERQQKDFEQWLAVMTRQYQSSNSMTSKQPPLNSTLRSSSSSTTSSGTKVADPKVQENLMAFYKARDEIYNGMGAGGPKHI